TEALVEDGDARVSASVRSAAAAGARVVAAPVADANGMARLWQAGVHYLLGEAIAQQPPG
ncbi:MAG: hypothetical protein L0H83_13310, partial [Salinisphaera sp.]|nr:hypothetical protein [Salinisphaera sp.]